MLKKFQKYLLENHPIYWQTKFWQMLCVSILLWFAAFALGFLSTNMHVLSSKNISDYYFSWFLLYHIIIGIVIYIFWSLSFFQSNAFKNFYPLSKFHHHKIFIQVFIPAALILTLYYPFTLGVFQKTKVLLNKNELLKDALVLNKAYPFLIESNNRYTLGNRVYPNPFPLAMLEKQAGHQNWNSGALYLNPKISQSPLSSSLTHWDTSNLIYDANTYSKPFLVDGSQIIFYASHEFVDKSDTCSIRSYALIDSFIQPDKKYLKHYKCVQNFSELFIEDYEWTKEIQTNVVSDRKYYKTVIAPSVHEYCNSNNGKAIINSLDSFAKICDKYQIEHYIPSVGIATELIKNDFSANDDLIAANEYSYNSNVHSANDESDNANTNSKPYLGYVETGNLKMIFSNYSTAEFKSFESYVLSVCAVIALLLSCLIILAYSVDLVSGILSIPVKGIVMTLFSLVFISFHIDGQSGITAFTILFSAVFFVLGFVLTSSTQLGKRLITIMLLLGFYSIPYLITALLNIVHMMTETRTQHCYNTDTHYGYEMSFWHVYFLTAILFFMYLPNLKKLKAKAE